MPVQRPHRPHELGPRVYRKGRWWSCDLRPWGYGRPTMRDPNHPAWPNAGARTELEDVARLWVGDYWKWVQDQARAEAFGGTKERKLADAIEEYLEYRSRIVELNTWQSDRTSLSHLAHDFRGRSIHQVDPQRTINRLLGLVDVSTVKTYSAYLSSFFSWLGLPYSVTLPKSQKPDVVVWTDSEIQRIREAADVLGSLLAVDLGLYMGLRVGEIYGLRWEDVGERTVRVQRQVGGRPLKGKRARTAVVLPEWGHTGETGTVVEDPGEWSRSGVIRAVLALAGISRARVGWHSLRHTYARMFLERSPDMRLLQASLGHASITTTETAYNHLLPDAAAELAIARIWPGSGTTSGTTSQEAYIARDA